LATPQRDNVAEVKAAVDIVDVAARYVDLKPAGGARFKALCPFHREKTPSFHIMRDRQIFHCFGCGKGGDVLSFVQEIEGVEFREALEQLAERAGIRLEYRGGDGGKQQDNRQALFKATNFAGRFYRNLYTSDRGAVAREYVAGRNLKPETIERFALGYAPEGWQSLVDAARAESIGENLLESAGLAKRGQGGVYDRFRHRVMFPIREVGGKIIGFGGRTLGDGDAKYLNSAESPVYKKSRVLYGLFEAREALRESQKAIIVEGYFDLLRCFDSGIENVLATCGTALTDEQAKTIRRYAANVLVVFDGDAAGIRAALRSIGILCAAGLTVHAMALPDGLDPDDYIRREGPEAFRKLAADAPGFVSFYVRMNSDRSGTIEGRRAIAGELFEVLRGLDDPLRQDEYVKLVASELGLDEFRCREAFRQADNEAQKSANMERMVKPAAPPVNTHDIDFVAILMENLGWAEAVWKALDGFPLPESPVVEVLRRMAESPGEDLTRGLETADARQLYSAAAAATKTWGEQGERLVRERVSRFKREALLAEREQIDTAIRSAKRQKNESEETELVLRKIVLNKQIEQLGAA
jgi:DNA primase